MGRMKKMTMAVAALMLISACASIANMGKETPQNDTKGSKSTVNPGGATAQKGQLGPDQFNTKVVSLASQLSSYLQNYDVASRTVVVTTFVGLDSLKSGTKFGRLLSEQLVYSLHTMGYRVFELRTSKEIKLQENNGEFFLTRKAEETFAPYRPDAVIVGTFQVVENSVSVQARMVDSGTSRIVSVANIVFQLDEDPYAASLLAAPAAEEPRAQNEPLKSSDMASIEIRELSDEGTDAPHKLLALKMDRASREIARNMTSKKPPQTVAVSAFVDVDRLNRSNTFGRFLTEGLMEGMARRGLAVVETRAAKNLMVQPNVGEHALTREADEMGGPPSADAVVLGTYARAGETVYVHARMVVPESRRVISVASFQVKLAKDDPFMREMLANDADRVGANPFRGAKK